PARGRTRARAGTLRTTQRAVETPWLLLRREQVGWPGRGDASRPRPRDGRAAGLREEVEALGHRKASRSRGGRASEMPRAARETLSVDVVEHDVVSEEGAIVRGSHAEAARSNG